MAARTPEECHRLFGQAFSAGDLDALMALYEPAGKLVPEAGKAAVSGGAIRETLTAFLALKPTISLETEEVVKTEDIALLRSKWTLRATGPDGKPVTMSHRGTEVARRQPDGTWRFVIDHPFGAD
jgi:uncharacterized protein (TIGR02246 family)